jgi:L-ascorbate metabolism protein UlaG (beta-lactamase superfamily)
MSVKISRILHAGYVFEHKETQILFDPIFENPFSHNCYAFPNVRFDVDSIKKLKPSAVFISHYHDDHCSFESLNLINRNTPLYIYCVFDEMLSLLTELGFTNVTSLDLNIPIQIDEIVVTPRAALDRDVDSMFHIQVEGLNILNVVDSWIDPDCLTLLIRFAPWDLVLWPFQTMKEIDVLSPRQARPADRNIPDEWLKQLQILKPKSIVPSSCQFIFESWSWMNQAYFPISYQQFESDVVSHLPKTKVLKLNPSCSLILDGQTVKKGPPLNWIYPLGSQDLDYIFQQSFKAPKTSEIAKQFEALSETNLDFVLQFCTQQLIDTYENLEVPEESLFSNPMTWKLSIFDHLGRSTDFFYEIHGQNIKLLEKSRQEIDWLTEIPSSKLFAALKGGQATNSIYIRMNDFEGAGQDLDPMLDPLLRCIYGREFASYQKYQLSKIIFDPR